MEQKGITLIALIITIIILLILAGISIAMLTGENGLLTKAITAGEESKKAEYEEALKLLATGLRSDQFLDQLDKKEFIDRYAEEFEKEKIKTDLWKNASQERKNEQTIWVITKEGWIFKVTEDEVIYIGNRTDSPIPPNLTQAEMRCNYTPSNWTKGSVKLEIQAEVKGGTLQYSKDANIWEDYDSKTGIVVKQNGTIYARFKNNLDEVGGYATASVTNIDRNPVTGSIHATATKDSATVTVSASDAPQTATDGCSGIKGYYYSNDGGSNYTNITTSASFTFTSLQPETNYNIAVKIVDYANNETVLRTSITTESQRYYIVRNGILQDNNYTLAGPEATIKQESSSVVFQYCWGYGHSTWDSGGISWSMGNKTGFSKVYYDCTWQSDNSSYGAGWIKAAKTPVPRWISWSNGF